MEHVEATGFPENMVETSFEPSRPAHPCVPTQMSAVGEITLPRKPRSGHDVF